jgi:TPR repeat protein
MAATWYRTALERGDASIQTLALLGLARIYEQGGYGVQQDYVQAYKFFDIAAAHKSGLDYFGDCTGDACPSKLAAFSRDQIAAKMTQDQIDEAQRLARNRRQ